MNSTIELEDDIKYLKTIINKYSKKKSEKKETANNKQVDFHSKIDFVVCQFKNMFDKH